MFLRRQKIMTSFEKNATSNRLFLVLRKNFILLPPGELLKVWSFSFVLVIHSLDGFTLTLKITCCIMCRYTYCFQHNCLTLFYIIWKYTNIYTFFSDSDIRNKISQIHCFLLNSRYSTKESQREATDLVKLKCLRFATVIEGWSCDWNKEFRHKRFNFKDKKADAFIYVETYYFLFIRRRQ